MNRKQPQRLTRRDIQRWLAPMRAAIHQMRSGEVDSIRGYAVTRLHVADNFARTDYCIAGFRALMARLLPQIDMAPLERLEKRLAAGVLLTVAEIDAALATINQTEPKLARIKRDALKSAVLTEQIAIELDHRAAA